MKKTDLTIGGSTVSKEQPNEYGDLGGGIEEAMAKHVIANSDPNKPIAERLVDAVKTVYDPEIPVNIYELGLIYNIDFNSETGAVNVIMTLTSPACPAAQELPGSVQRAIGRVPEVTDVDVDITFDPPWSQEKMSDEAKLTLGLL
jgi:FeS assembly SUF system protein